MGIIELVVRWMNIHLEHLTKPAFEVKSVMLIRFLLVFQHERHYNFVLESVVLDTFVCVSCKMGACVVHCHSSKIRSAKMPQS